MWGLSVQEVVLLAVALVGFSVWLAALVDCARNCPERSRVAWILLVVVLNWVGALAYFYYRKRNT